MKTCNHKFHYRLIPVGITKSSALALAATLALTLGQYARAQTVLINPTTLNGDFELPGGGVGYTFVSGNVPDWAVWGSSVGGPSTADNNSGTAYGATGNTTPTHSLYWAYFQPGVAVYDLTSYAIQGGDTLTFSFDTAVALGHNGTYNLITGGLAYENPGNGNIVAIAGSTVTSSTIGQATTTFSFVVPNSASYIGDQVAFTLDNSVLGSNYPNDDNIVLTVTPAPEPQTWALLSGGIGLLAFVRRFRTQA